MSEPAQGGAGTARPPEASTALLELPAGEAAGAGGSTPGGFGASEAAESGAPATGEHGSSGAAGSSVPEAAGSGVPEAAGSGASLPAGAVGTSESPQGTGESGTSAPPSAPRTLLARLNSPALR